MLRELREAFREFREVDLHGIHMKSDLFCLLSACVFTSVLSN